MINVFTFGSAEIAVGDLSVKPTSPRKFALLLRLASEPGRRVSRGALHELVFPDRSESSAKHSLREAIYQLRRNGAPLIADKGGVFVAADRVAADYAEAISTRRLSPDQLQAIAGGFLPSYSPHRSEAYGEWFEAFRSRTTLALSRVLVECATKSRVACAWRDAEAAARACLALDSLNDEATLILAEAMAVGGSKTKALEFLDGYLGELGDANSDLRLPANVLKRRISERLSIDYTKRFAGDFVGRSREMQLLSDSLAVVRRGETRSVVVHGEAGIGKTRLASEFANICVLSGCHVVRIGAQPLDAECPMSAFVDLVPQLLDLPGAIGCSPETLALLRRLTRHSHARDTDQPAHPDGKALAESSSWIAAQMATAIYDIIDAVTGESPLVILADDAQWMDLVSLRLINSLIARPSTRRLLLVLGTRPEAVVTVSGVPEARRILLGLPKLDPDACLALLRAVFPGASDEDESLRQWMLRAADGNPFFLDCLVAHFLTTGERFVVPPRLNSLVEQRLDSLSIDAIHVLYAVVALGRHATLERLVRVLDVETLRLLTAIKELEDARLIANGALIQVAHWLISEGVVSKRTPVVARLIHSRIARALQQESKESDDAAFLWSCAEHWAAAGDCARAADAFVECAEHALEIGRAREAARLLIRAASFSDGPRKIPFLNRSIQTAAAASEYDVVLEATELKPRVFSRQHDDCELAEIIARSRVETRIDDQSASRLRECVAEASATPEHRLEAGLALLMWCDLNREPEIANATFSVLGTLCETMRHSHPLLVAKSLTVYHSCFGKLDAAADFARQLLQIAGNSPSYLAADLYRKAAIGLWRAGEIEEAMVTFETAFRTAESSGSERLQLVLALILTGDYEDIGQPSEGEKWRAIVDQMASLVRDPTLQLIYDPIVTEIALSRGDHDDVLRIGQRIKRDSVAGHRRGERWYHALRLLITWINGGALDWESEISRLVEVQSVGFELGDVADFETAVVALGLTKYGQREAACSLLSRYFAFHRRGRTPLSSALWRAIRELDFRRLPTWVVESEDECNSMRVKSTRNGPTSL